MDVEVVSKVGTANCADYQLYGFLSDFNNIAKILPPEMRNKLDCTSDSCTIEAGNGMSIKLVIIEKEPSKLIKIGASEGKSFFIWIQTKQVAPYDTRVRITIKTEMNMVMKALSKKKIQEFADGFVDVLCRIPVGVM